MTSNSADPVWDAVVELMLPLGPGQEQRSRYGDKPALAVTATREIAHLEGPGVVDVRITRACWRPCQRRTSMTRGSSAGGTRTGSSFS